MSESKPTTITVKYDKDTKRGRRFTGRVLGISISVYIDNEVKAPKEIKLEVKE